MITPADQRLSDMATALHAELARQPMDSPDFIALAKAADAVDSSRAGRFVWLVTITHRLGRDSEVFSAKAKATAYLAAWCRKWWPEVADDESDEAPTDDAELISVYFDRSQDESVDIESLEIDRA